MDRRMKRIDYRPENFKTMDPSFRFGMWRWEKEAGRLFNDSKRLATFHSALLAVAVGGLYGTFMWLHRKQEKEFYSVLDYGPDADKKVKKKST